MLGVLFNSIDMGSALATVDSADFMRAAAAGGSMVPIPLAWALMCAIPLWLASTCFRQRMPAAAR